MPISNVAQWSVTPSLNVDIGGIPLDGNVTLIAQLDDGFRNIMAQVAAQFLDDQFYVGGNSDPTKKVKLDVSGLTTATTRTLVVPDKNGTIALTSDLVQSTYATYTANTDISAAGAIPIDDTIPQITEGTQILSVAITPRSTTNRLRIRVTGCVADTATEGIAGAIFNGAASAIRSWYNVIPAGHTHTMAVDVEYVPGVLTAQTISVRVSPQANTMRLNGTTAGRLFGGSLAAVLIVEEIKA